MSLSESQLSYRPSTLLPGGKASIGLAAIWTLAVILALPLFGMYAASRDMETGWQAAIAAAAVTWISGVLALVCVARSRRTNVLNGILGATLLRMMVPGTAMLIAFSVIGGSVGNLFAGLLVGYFLYGLLIETPILLRLCQSGRSASMGVKKVS